jgi:hypothetical protein
MRRRDFIAGLGSTMAAWPLTALAQQQTKPTVISLTLGPGLPPPEQAEGFAGAWPRSAFQTVGT